MKLTESKKRGIHYTPPELARFLAELLAFRLSENAGPLRVLDPACGDGALLAALAQALPAQLAGRSSLVGYETDPAATRAAAVRLAKLPVAGQTLLERDFLAASSAGDSGQPSGFDAVIANPPYVRTQVLGARLSGSLARRFNLSGRVDLYYAFARAMADVLRPGGVLGLLVSNRFLSIKSGSALRSLLRTQFRLEAIYDLGDTRLFAAAVLPAIIIATKQSETSRTNCRFVRVYGQRSIDASASQSGASPAAKTTEPVQSPPAAPSILAALADDRTAGLVRAPAGLFHVERGFLSQCDCDGVWTLANRQSRAWLKTVQRHAGATFDDVGRVRVGIKTTADEIFIRDDWDRLPESRRPEPELLRPLLRHFSAARWTAGPRRQMVLYPHCARDGRRQAIDLAEFPRARRYLKQHEERLSRRRYLTESGRQWYEIWVPHNPADWSLPKIVFPDIAAEPRFFLDRSGAVVNGDCYWITLREGRDWDWLLLLLAVANSSLVSHYYDLAFHNKLYSGRRRFMTQYVRQFPLPKLENRSAREAIERTRQLLEALNAETDGRPCEADALETEIDALVWQAFGLVRPASG